MKDLISIVIPAFNEEEVIPELVKRLTKLIDSISTYEFEIIIVENASIDKTSDVLLRIREKESRLKIVQLVKNEGCDGAIIAGLTYAQGKAAIVMMADLQDDPDLIPKFIQKWEEGYAIVYGIVKKRPGVAITRRFGTYVFYKLINYLTKGLLPENVSDFRLLDRKVYKVITSIPEHNKFFRGLVIWTGYKKIGIPFERPPRFAGHSKADFATVLTVALNGITAFSNFPLRIPWIVAFLSGFIGVVSIFFGMFYLTLGMIFSMLIFMLLGIQGEYIARIFEEVRNRPSFIVRNTYGLKTLETSD